MKIIQKVVKESAQNYCQKHISIINSLLSTKLTQKEIEVLCAFIQLPEAVDRFSPYGRKEVKKKLGLSNGGLSNFIKGLKEKGCIKEGPYENLYIAEVLIPAEKEQGYQIKLTRDED